MKEFYVDKPAEIEVYTHGGCTDIILRKSIAQDADEEGNPRWTCEERQMRQPGTISAESVKADLPSLANAALAVLMAVETNFLPKYHSVMEAVVITPLVL